MKQFNAIRLLFCAFAISVLAVSAPPVYAQSATEQTTGRLIKGEVVDDEGEPLPGATIRIKGSKGVGAATTTNYDGAFSLRYNGNSRTVTISVSYIGMVTKDVDVDFKNPVKVTLESDALKLSEVTVVDDGYNRLPRRDMVGAYQGRRCHHPRIFVHRPDASGSCGRYGCVQQLVTCRSLSEHQDTRYIHNSR